MVTIAFACMENAGRSQMAAAWARLRDEAGVRVLSGGTRPAARVHPEVVAVMRELGLDLASEVPRIITPQEVGSSDVVVTMGCAAGDVCPTKFRGDVVDWARRDPAGKPLEEARRIRDEIQRRVTVRLDGVAYGR